MKRTLILGIWIALLLLRFDYLQGQSYTMTSGTVTVNCSQSSVTFYDPGGPGGDCSSSNASGNYSNYTDITQTFVSSDPNKCLRVTFTSFCLESASWDYLRIYDGANTSSTLNGTYGGTTSPGVITATSGSLTFVFHTDGSVNKAGWVATISCVDCDEPIPPTPPPTPTPSSPCYPNGIHPFCTDENPYGITYSSGTSGENASSFLGSNSYSCLYTTPNPAWYYMQIDDPGDLLIYIQQVNASGSGLDVDFVCWGPFTASSQSDFVDKLCSGEYSLDNYSQGSHRPSNGNHQNDMGGYPDGNVVDCSYSAQSTEWCFIPNTVHGQWYLFLLTNYSGQAGTITYSVVDEYSTATTNCNLLALITYNAPLCEGDTLVLTCENPQEGATYNWSGPGGWADTTTVPYVEIPNATTSQSGQYSLLITGLSSTVDSSYVDVTIHAFPEVTLTASHDTICKGQRVTLQASGATTYQWSPISSSASSVSVKPNSTTVYTVTGSVTLGCSDTATLQVTVIDPSPGDTTAVSCEPFNWYGQNITVSGEYTHTLTNWAGCDSVVTLHFSIGSPPEATINASQNPICVGDTVTLSVVTDQDTLPLSYHWNTGDTTALITMMPDETTEYSVTVTNSYGCTDSVSLTVAVGMSSTQTLYDTVCQGEGYNANGFTLTEAETDTPGELTLTRSEMDNGCTSTTILLLTVHESPVTTLNESACDSYEWNDSTYFESGEYTKHFRTVHDCDSTVTLNLTIGHTPEITIVVSSDTLCPGDNVTLTAEVANNTSPELSYRWSTGDTTASIDVVMEQTALYAVTVTDPAGCSDSATRELEIFVTEPMTDILYRCIDSSIVMTARDAANYQWNTGETVQTVTVSLSGVYLVQVTPFSGCPVTDTFKIFTMLANPFSEIGIPEMCAGESYPISVGHDSNSNLIVQTHETSLAFNDTVFLPDGVSCEPFGCSYRSLLHLGSYYDTAHITSAEDIRYVRINLEHSYSGDLYIRLTCPNGQKADILRYGNATQYSSVNECWEEIPVSSFEWQAGGTNASLSTYFGIANSNSSSQFPCNSSDPNNVPGVGWNYCWSNNTLEGYTYADGEGSLVYRSGNLVIPAESNFHYVFDSSDVVAGTQFYHPDESFDSLIGCPLNGLWYIEVTDGNPGGNGYLFGWELALSEDYQTFGYADVSQIEIDGPWITPTGDSTFLIAPPVESILHDTVVHYTVHSYSSNGCDYDTVVSVNIFIPHDTTILITACDSTTWQGQTFTADTILHDTIATTSGCDSIVIVEIHVIQTSTVIISGAQFFCTDSSVTLTAITDVEPLSYLWNNGETDGTITVSEPGTYTVTAYYEEGCSTESDDFHTFVSENPIIDAHLSDMVAGDTQRVVIGSMVEDNLQYANPQNVLTYSVVTFLPDGVPCEPLGCSYKAEMDISGFPDSAVIQSANDIRYIRLNMEHSAPIDLYINLICPNGQQADILKKYDGGSTSECMSLIGDSHKGWPDGNINTVYNVSSPHVKAWMGSPNIFPSDNDATHQCDSTKNKPGIGWNYCWSNNTTEGYLYASANGCLVDTSNALLHYNSQGIINRVVIDSSNVAEGSQFYHPDVSFDSLAGCPVNGIWTVEVIDGIVGDNGYIFECELGVADHLASNHYAPLAQMDFDSLWVTRLNDSVFTITPPDTLADDTTVAYTFTLTDENGCVFDTTVYITIYAHRITELYDTVDASELPYVWNGVEFTHAGCQSDTLHRQFVAGADSAVTMADSILIMHLSVIYTFDTAVCESEFEEGFYWNQVTFFGTDTIEVSELVEDGCADSIARLIMVVKANSAGDTIAEACDYFTWYEMDYYETGEYETTLPNAAGCDSVVTLHLTIHPFFDEWPDPLVICESELPYPWYDTVFDIGTVSGEYVFYDTSVHGCDSLTTLNLTVLPTYLIPLADTICEGDTFIFHGRLLTEADVYYDTLQTETGCDSIVALTLTVNPTYSVSVTDTICEGDTFIFHGRLLTEADIYYDTLQTEMGCDSIVVLTLTVNPTYSVSVTDTICEGDSFNFHGQLLTEANIYYDTLQTETGCDSIVVLTLTVNPTYTVSVTDTICEGDTFNFHNRLLTEANIYYDTLQTETGCDSIVVLTLTVNPTYSVSVTDTICEGDSFNFHNRLLTEADIYYDTLQAVTGCDSIVALTLTVHPIYSVPIAATIYSGDTFNFHGQLLTEPDVYYDTLQTVTGCDSIVELTLTVFPTYSVPVADTICSGDTFNFHNRLLTEPGVYYDTLQTETGGDSIVVLTLTVNPTNTIPVADAICEGDTFIFHNRLLTEPDVYYDTLQTVTGCDSIVVLTLTVHPTYSVSVTDTICEGDTFHFHNRLLTEPDVYYDTLQTINGCDSIVALTLTVHPTYMIPVTDTICEGDTFIFHNRLLTEPDVYYDTLQTINGCDSIVALTLTVNPTYTVPVEASICSGDTFIFHNRLLTEPDIYYDTLQTVTGCDSVIVLQLTVNQIYTIAFDTAVCENTVPFFWHGKACNETSTYYDSLVTVAGCDSIYILNLTVNTLFHSILDTSICESDTPFVWHNHHYNATGIYHDSLVNPMTGCDSIYVLNLVVSGIIRDTADVAICENGIPYTWRGHDYGLAGFYHDTISVSSGCDSILTLNLTINDIQHTLTDTSVCMNTLPFLWRGNNYDTAGIYYDSLVSPTTGCDSVFILQLAVSQCSLKTSDTNVCEDILPFPWRGKICNAPGIYYDSLITNKGCDSIYVLDLTVSEVFRDTNEIAVCSNELPYQWHNQYFSGTGIYFDSLTSSCNCDSIYILALTVMDSTFSDVYDTVLENSLPYSLNGELYDSTGVYVQLLENAAGCDSIVTLYLTVYRNMQTVLDTAVCDSLLPFIWNDIVFTTPSTGSITVPASTGADSTVIMVFSVKNSTSESTVITIVENQLPYSINGYTYDSAGTYIQHLTNAAGCDSVLTLHLLVANNNVYYKNATVCQNMLPIQWEGHQWTEGGVVIDTYTAASGADSIVVKTLTVGLPTTNDIYDTILQNELPYVLNDNSYYEPGNYVQHRINGAGCDSAITLHLTVLFNERTELDSTLCDSLLPIVWNGVTFSESGVDSVTYTTATGVDSTVVMTVTVNASSDSTLTVSVAESALPYSVNGFDYDSSGIYVQHLDNAMDCDSTLTIVLTVLQNVRTEVDSTVCDSDSLWPVVWNGVEFTGAGTDSVTMTASTGVDSTVVMTVHLNYPTEGTFADTVLENELQSYQLNGVSYDSAGTYTQHLTNAFGCDSLLTFQLTVLYNVGSEVDSTVCPNALPLTWNGQVFTAAGVQSAVLTAANGVDSIVTMTLELWDSAHANITSPPTLCTDSFAVLIADSATSYLWSTGDTTRFINAYATGIYSVTVTNEYGCTDDTSVFVNIYAQSHTVIDTTVCDSFIWNGNTYTQSQEIVWNGVNTNGCDSTITINLTVNYSFVIYDTLHIVQNQLPYYFEPSDTLFPVGSPPESQFSYTVPTQSGCDSTVMEMVYVYMNCSSVFDTTVCAAALPLSWRGHTFTAAGTVTDSLQTVHGSDSVLTYTVTVDELSATIGNITHINCYGESTGAATATVTGGIAPLVYQWTNGAGASVSVTTQISNRPAGNYTFTVTDAFGCSVSESVTLNTLHGEMLPGTVTGPQTLCFGDTLGTVSGTTATGDDCVYQWQVSTDGNTWSPASGTNNTQNYTLSSPATSDFYLRRAWISGGCGTLYSDTLAISVWPVSSDTLYDELCAGQPYQQHGFDIPGTEVVGPDILTFREYYANVNGCDSVVTLMLTVYETQETNLDVEICEGEGFYADGFAITAEETVGADTLRRVLNLLTADGCDSIVRLEAAIIDTALRIESLTSDFCEEMQAELVVVTNMTDYEWSTGEQMPNITVTDPGMYGVTASQGGCRAHAEYVIEPCVFELYLPNVITPGREEGLNDYFGISEHAQGMINLFEISIFNRWGEMVFYSTDKGFRWNGEVKGQIYHQNVYNYIINYTDSAGRLYRVTGSLTVL